MNLEWLNYHHLLYFWATAKEGGVAKASTKLRLAQPTISGQIRQLEDSLGEKLFQRAGRGLVMTEVGRVVYRYADEIFSLGRELRAVLNHQTAGRAARINVGVADTLPKLMSYRLLQAALRLEEPVRVVCREDRPDRLFSDLGVHALDLVLSDVPLGPDTSVRAHNHSLGESPLAILGTHELVERYRDGFPQSLNDAPFLLPGENANARRALQHWFDTHEIRPRIVGEFDDSALIKAFGAHGEGLFAAPEVLVDDVLGTLGVEVLATLDVKEHYYLISVEKKIKHPAVAAIMAQARKGLRPQK